MWSCCNTLICLVCLSVMAGCRELYIIPPIARGSTWNWALFRKWLPHVVERMRRLLLLLYSLSLFFLFCFLFSPRFLFGGRTSSVPEKGRKQPVCFLHETTEKRHRSTSPLPEYVNEKTPFLSLSAFHGLHLHIGMWLAVMLSDATTLACLLNSQNINLFYNIL